MVVQPCEYMEQHWILYFKWMDCTICELYLSKLKKKKNESINTRGNA